MRPNQPDQGSLNDPLWVPDYQNNPALVGLTPTQQCTRFNDTPGWYGRYFDYPSNHPDMEMSSNWTNHMEIHCPHKKHGRPIGTMQNIFVLPNLVRTWNSVLISFHFDYAPEQFIAGHAYILGRVVIRGDGSSRRLCFSFGFR